MKKETQSTSSLALVAAVSADGNDAREGSFPEKRRGGPKTLAGKRRSSLNRLGGGLYANALLTKGEDREEYLRFARSIVAGLDVQTALEMACAERIVSALWRSRRARRYEQAHLDAFADEAHRKFEVLKTALDAVRDHERCSELVERLGSGIAMRAEEAQEAASAISDIFGSSERYDEALLDELWALFPQSGRLSAKRVAEIAEKVWRTLRPALMADSVYELWVWIVDHLASEKRELQIAAIRAGREYSEALRQTFVLDATQGDQYEREARAGRVLEDAERRLDRQVSRALADLEAARRLRPSL